jgi:hypothetical protein
MFLVSPVTKCMDVCHLNKYQHDLLLVHKTASRGNPYWGVGTSPVEEESYKRYSRSTSANRFSVEGTLISLLL